VGNKAGEGDEGEVKEKEGKVEGGDKIEEEGGDKIDEVEGVGNNKG
jgi:hypothetical protein